MTEAEQFLLEGIRRGDEQAWSQLVDRYQGRLLSFAQSRLGQRADCEDIVQDTFVGFVRALATYRGDCSLETFLFGMLRRKIIDCYRRRGASHICLIQDVQDSRHEESSGEGLNAFATPDPSVSWYLRRDEQAERVQAVLTAALTELVGTFKKTPDFTSLQIVELVFYCQLSNSDAAAALGITANRVGVTKHRCLQRVRTAVEDSPVELDPESDAFENLLTSTWQALRPSCPKRSTIGRFLLQTLEADWQAYVDFHLHQLGCHFCRANLADLERQNRDADHPRALHTRIMQSTVGFLKKA